MKRLYDFLDINTEKKEKKERARERSKDTDFH